MSEDTQSDSVVDQPDSGVDDKKLKEAEKKVASMGDRYEPGARPTVVVEGTNGTVAGTAFASEDDIKKHESERDDGENE